MAKKQQTEPVQGETKAAASELEALLTTLQKFNVSQYSSGDFTVHLGPKIELAKSGDLEKKNIKTKEQIAEEELFHSVPR